MTSCMCLSRSAKPALPLCLQRSLLATQQYSQGLAGRQMGKESGFLAQVLSRTMKSGVTSGDNRLSAAPGQPEYLHSWFVLWCLSSEVECDDEARLMTAKGASYPQVGEPLSATPLCSHTHKH